MVSWNQCRALWSEWALSLKLHFTHCVSTWVRKTIMLSLVLTLLISSATVCATPLDQHFPLLRVDHIISKFSVATSSNCWISRTLIWLLDIGIKTLYNCCSEYNMRFLSFPLLFEMIYICVFWCLYDAKACLLKVDSRDWWSSPQFLISP